MPDISALLLAGATNPWLLLPAAVGLGMVHALEPGHAKAMIAAFIVAVRSTLWQAMVLAISATVGHTIVVWGVALLARAFGSDAVTRAAEPWLMLISGILVAAMALRLLWLSSGWRLGSGHGQHHEHAYGHDHDHSHAGADHHHDHGGGIGHRHDSSEEIVAKYGGRANTTPEVAWFGFTGGLLPCSAAIAVLLVSLQMDSVALGFAMVLAFSIGLGLTLAAIGILAVWGATKARSSWSDFDRWSDRLQQLSMVSVLLMGIGMIYAGVTALRSAA